MMSVEDEVIVIGAGIAGRMAALAAARRGASVRVISHKESTLAHASGLIDILGYHEDDPVSSPYATIKKLPPGHPYSHVGSDGVRTAMDCFDRVTTSYCGGHTDSNALVPTIGGRLKPTARYPESVAPGLASRPVDTLLIGFETMPDFHAPATALTLERIGVPFDVRGETIRFPVELRPDAGRTRLARALATDEPVDGGGCRSALAARIAPVLGDAGRVGLPAVLGDGTTDGIRESLADHLGVAVFEIPTGPPSLLGHRLKAELTDALQAAAVRIETGNPVVGHNATDNRIDAVLVQRSGDAVPYAADRFVLATGGLVGRGLRADRTTVTEPIFNCHISHPSDRYDWSEPEAFGDHHLARFGVRIDEFFRPLEDSGAPTFRNLHAAGAVLGGADPAAEKSASGISIATGYHAGRVAAEGAT